MGLPAGGIPDLEEKAVNQESERYGKLPAQKSIQTGRSRSIAPKPRRVRPTGPNSRPAADSRPTGGGPGPAAGGSRGRGERWKSGTVPWTGAPLHREALREVVQDSAHGIRVARRKLVRRVDEVRLDDYVLAELQLGLQVLIDSHQGIVDILAPVLTLGDRHGGAALQSRERFRISSVPPAPSTRRRPGRGPPPAARTRPAGGRWGPGGRGPPVQGPVPDFPRPPPPLAPPAAGPGPPPVGRESAAGRELGPVGRTRRDFGAMLRLRPV